jgi:Putative transmembrane protein (PGPGW)
VVTRHKELLGARGELFKKAIERWRLSRAIEVGHRFQTRYHSHRRRREQGQTSRYGRLLNVMGGPALIVAGLAFIPTPSPSYIIIVIGMWMLAGEFLPLARFFDRLEVSLRRLGRWIKERWKTLPALVRVLAIFVCAATLGYGLYSLISGG